MNTLQDKILDWLANGQTGISSKHMALTAIGKKSGWNRTPSDPSDLNRCILLVDAVPEIKEKFSEIAATSKGWKAVVDHWDELVETFHAEVGKDWSKGRSAPKTYKRMKDLNL